MELDSKSLSRELRHAISSFPQAVRFLPPVRCQHLLAPAALFRRPGTLLVRRRSTCLRCLLPGRHPILVLCLDGCFSRRATVCLFRSFSGRVRFVSRFCRLFLFFLFLWNFLDSRQLPQNLFALLESLAATRQLHGKHLFHDLVKLCAARHTQSLKLVPHHRQSDAHRPPFVQIRSNLGQCRGVRRLRKQIGNLIQWHLLQEAVRVDRGIQLLSDQFLLCIQGLLRETQGLVDFRGTVPGLREHGALLAIFEPSENRQQRRRTESRPEARGEQILANLH